MNGVPEEVPVELTTAPMWLMARQAPTKAAVSTGGIHWRTAASSLCPSSSDTAAAAKDDNDGAVGRAVAMEAEPPRGDREAMDGIPVAVEDRKEVDAKAGELLCDDRDAVAGAGAEAGAGADSGVSTADALATAAEGALFLGAATRRGVATPAFATTAFLGAGAASGAATVASTGAAGAAMGAAGGVKGATPAQLDRPVTGAVGAGAPGAQAVQAG